jgi:hypothetical protein
MSYVLIKCTIIRPAISDESINQSCGGDGGWTEVPADFLR